MFPILSRALEGPGKPHTEKLIGETFFDKGYSLITRYTSADSRAEEGEIAISIFSMTGFARVEGGVDTCVWTWEAKSVNAKGLDVRLRLPRILDALEARAREGVAKRFKRGNISLNLEIEWNKPLSVLSVNEDVLAQILKAVSKIQAALPQARAPAVDGILALKGVLEQTESARGDKEYAALEKDILSALDAVLEQVADGREAEGQRLGAVLHDQLADI